MKEVVNGPKKAKQEPSAIRDPANGELVVSGEEIKRVTLKYCVDNLTNKSANKEVEMEKELRRTIHQLRMEEDDSEEFDVVWGDFKELLCKFGLKKTKSYDFLLKAGGKYKKSMFNLCKKNDRI